MALIPTVRVEKPSEVGGYRIINESDYDRKTHRLWNAEKAAKAIAKLNHPAPKYSHTIGAGGSWTVSLDGEEIKRGRGKAKLAEFLKSLEA